MKIKKSQQWYIQLFSSVMFVVLIISPLMNRRLSFLFNQSEIVEKRGLAPKPEFTFKSLEAYPEMFEKYYNDYFPFRNILIRWNSIFKIKYLKVSPLPYKVIIGKGDWLFYADEGALDNYKRTKLFSLKELERISQRIEKRNVWLLNRGITYYIMLTPEKQTIYPEFMPDSIKRAPNISKLDQVVEYLRKHSKVRIVDVQKDLYAEKINGHMVFRKIDTHWNQYGAFIASNSLLGVIAKDFSVIHPPAIKDFSITLETVTRGDLTDMLALKGDIWRSERIPRLTSKDEKRVPGLFNVNQQIPFKIESFVIVVRDIATLPRLVMFRDSFATSLIPFISAHFSRSVYVWSFSFDTNLIEKEKPNLVVSEFNERYLDLYIDMLSEDSL